MSPIGKENIKNIRGEVSGNVNLWGPIESPYHTGKLKLNNSGLKINYINADYLFIDGTEIFLVNQSFNLKNTKFIDNKNRVFYICCHICCTYQDFIIN